MPPRAPLWCWNRTSAADRDLLRDSGTVIRRLTSCNDFCVFSLCKKFLIILSQSSVKNQHKKVWMLHSPFSSKFCVCSRANTGTKPHIRNNNRKQGEKRSKKTYFILFSNKNSISIVVNPSKISIRIKWRLPHLNWNLKFSEYGLLSALLILLRTDNIRNP